MKNHLKRAAIVFIVVFAAAQLVRPNRTNPAIVADHTIQAQTGATGGIAPIVNRSCRDCHSNGTEWPWYSQVAPVSWLMTYGVAKGRRAVNFSEWAAYPPDAQRMMLAASCDDVTAGKMPGPYTLLRPETRLSPEDVQAICAAARQADIVTRRDQ